MDANGPLLFTTFKDKKLSDEQIGRNSKILGGMPSKFLFNKKMKYPLLNQTHELREPAPSPTHC